MKKNLEKMIWILVMVITLTGTMAAGFMIGNKKSAPQRAQTQSIQVSESIPSVEAEPCTITYVYYYRHYNGWLQRRKFNRTQNKWAEPYWHYVEKL